MHDAASGVEWVVSILTNYHASDAQLHAPEVADAMSGKTLLQLASGSPAEARRAAGWARERDVRYLDGAIMATPELMKRRTRVPKGIVLMIEEFSKVPDPRVDRTRLHPLINIIVMSLNDSARRAAAALTIITTCKRMGIDPRRYMRDTLQRLLAGKKDLAVLLPENYKPDIPGSTEQRGLAPARAA